MSTTITAGLALALLLRSGTADDPAETTARWRAHYAAVEHELLARTPAGLSEEQLRARARCVAALRAYRERGEFGRHELGAGLLVPLFVDAGGRRCAVAELLHASGNDALVARIAREANDAWVADLAGDAELARWLEVNGLTLEEAVRIQTPNSCSNCDSIPPGGHPSPPPDSSDGPEGPPREGRRPGDGPNQGGAGLPGSPTAGGIASWGSGTTAEEAWWIWWEYNKLAYLDVRGLGRRMVRDGGFAPDQLARLTAPLRSVRLPIVAAALEDPDAGVRAAAALAFGRMATGEEVLALVPLFEDPSRRVRESALFGLGASGTSEGAQVLLAILENGGAQRGGLAPITPRALPLAVLALAKGRRAGMDPGIAAPVAHMATRAPEVVRDATLWALCQFQRLAPAPEVEAVAIEVLRDESRPRWLRAAAVEALGVSSDPIVLARLQALLVGRDLDLRRSAALALARSPQASATGALLTAWELESEPLTRGFLLVSLGQRGDPRARALLLDVLATGPGATAPWAALGLGLHARANPDPALEGALLRAAALTRRESARPAFGIALGLAGARSAEASARRILARSPSVRSRGYAATTLALLGGAANREALREHLKREDSDFVRASVAQALSALGEAPDAALLASALVELADPVLQGVTAASLGLLGEPAGLATLDELLREGRLSPLVRATALDGLGLLLDRGEPLALPELSQASNYALYDDWTLELFLRAL